MALKPQIRRSRLYRIDLETGEAVSSGRVGTDSKIRDIAFLTPKR